MAKIVKCFVEKIHFNCENC